VWSKVNECGIDEVGVRQTADQFASAKGFGSLLLSRQASARCAFDLSEIVSVS
jgi:hypothetical protein